MFKTVITYSLKVWLTSVAIAPLFLIKDILDENGYGKDTFLTIPGELFSYMIFEVIFSVCTWICFTTLIFLALAITGINLFKKIIICIIGILLTVCTFQMTGVRIPELMIGNCVIIGASSLFYKLKSINDEIF